MSPTSLNVKLRAALRSRETRSIRRHLPDPAASALNSSLADFSSNDYLSLSRSPTLRSAFLAKLSATPDILGSGGSRLLVNGRAHSNLEARLARFFNAPAALLFNSGFDANVGFFSCVPQPGDVVLYDEHIHASVHDGVRASRAHDAHEPFPHNCIPSLHERLCALRTARPALASGSSSVFVAVESLYSMDGTIAPLAEIVRLLEEVFPFGNAHLVVDEAHATGVYGPRGRGLVALLGLEEKVLARLHTFGKALAGTGAVILTHTLMREYLVNYARPLIYTTSLSHANIIAVDCAFNMLEDGRAEQLSADLLSLSTYLTRLLGAHLEGIPASILALPAHLSAPGPPPALPTPIIPLLTAHPHALSGFLRERGMNARAITWPTVPRGTERVRVCLHAGNGRGEVERLVRGVVEWAGHVQEEAKL